MSVMDRYYEKHGKKVLGQMTPPVMPPPPAGGEMDMGMGGGPGMEKEIKAPITDMHEGAPGMGGHGPGRPSIEESMGKEKEIRSRIEVLLKGHDIQADKDLIDGLVAIVTEYSKKKHRPSPGAGFPEHKDEHSAPSHETPEVEGHGAPENKPPFGKKPSAPLVKKPFPPKKDKLEDVM